MAIAALGVVLYARARWRSDDRRADQAATLLSSVALSSTTRAFVRAAHKHWASAFVRTVEAVLGNVLSTAIDRGAPAGAVGVRAYVVRHRLVFPFRAHLSQVAAARLGGEPQPSGIQWTRGKGVIGRTWDLGRLIQMDLATTYRAYRDEPEAAWETAQPNVRLNLSWTEFERLARQYERVAAAPVFDRAGRVRGCVVMDVVVGCSFPLDDDMQRALAEAAVVVGRAFDRVPRVLYA